MASNVVRHTGMFKPGQSGNPAGRPKVDESVRDLARFHTKDAVETLAQICGNRKASDSARVQAATALLDRGWGKPVQTNQSINLTQTYNDFLTEICEKEEEEAAQKLLS